MKTCHTTAWHLSFSHAVLLVIALILTGCAIGHTKVDLSAIEIPPSDKAKVFVIRPDYELGRIVDLKVTANNNEIAALYNLSYTSFLMPQGKLTLSGDGRASAWPHREITIDVAGGQTYYIAWFAKEKNKAMRFLIGIGSVYMSSIQWEIKTKEEAQLLLNSTNYVAPKIENIP